MARRTYALSRWPRESSMSRRIASNSAARILDVRLAEMGVFGYVCDGHRRLTHI
jgi:hypothetical protein